jgi:hypothetical protein
VHVPARPSDDRERAVRVAQIEISNCAAHLRNASQAAAIAGVRRGITLAMGPVMRHLALASLSLLLGCQTGSDAGFDAGTITADVRHHRHDAGVMTAPDARPANDAAVSTGGVWHPAPGTTWQWQLTGTIDTTVSAQMFDIDLFDAPQVVIDTLHGKGSVVICYLSAGTYENWRPDIAQFPAAVRGNAVSGWPGEQWLDTRSATVRSIMETRMDLAVSKHCDGIEPDNVDGYTNNPGFPLTAATQLDYNQFLASAAHARGLSVGLKNDVDQAATLQPTFDWALDEECSKYSECNTLASFVAAGKAVFHTEYTKTCPAAVPGFSTILKSLNLDAPRTVCP